VKSIESRDAMANGADEIDMVINIGALKSGNDAMVLDDIRAVREATRGRVLKVILETALLSNEEKVRACLLSKQAGADFVKTSTGFSGGGATVDDIRLMRQTVGPMMGVKASGGIRDTATAQAMISAGATRLGTSASVAIVTDAKPASPGGGSPHRGAASPRTSEGPDDDAYQDEDRPAVRSLLRADPSERTDSALLPLLRGRFERFCIKCRKKVEMFFEEWWPEDDECLRTYSPAKRCPTCNSGLEWSGWRRRTTTSLPISSHRPPLPRGEGRGEGFSDAHREVI